MAAAQLPLARGSSLSRRRGCSPCSGDIRPSWKGGWNTLTEYLGKELSVTAGQAQGWAQLSSWLRLLLQQKHPPFLHPHLA